jgi:hypothetical protein
MSNVFDANAIAGDLEVVWGADVTAARCTCAACEASSYVAEAVVYMGGPGAVACCRACGERLIVLVTIRGITCVDLGGLAALEPHV